MKRFQIILMLIILGSSIESFSQITTKELPISVQKKIVNNLLTADNCLSTISLPAPDMDRIMKEDQEREENNNSPLRVSIGIPVSISINNDGVWTDLEDGGKLWQLKVSSENAKSLDFVFSKFWIPEGSKFFIFNPLTLETIGAITSEYILGDKESPHRLSTAMIMGDNVILEYYQPKDVKETPIIGVSKAYYGYRPEIEYKDTYNCNVNVNCTEGADWKKEKNAVAKVYAKLAYGYYCTGALLNNTQRDCTPYFLTANHNLTYNGNDPEPKDAVDNPDASDWVFYWNYELAHCNDTYGPQDVYTTSGATVVANNDYTDFALLELQQDPLSLSDYIPYYLGWDRSGDSGTGGVCIHHPNADVKKISTYTMTPTTTQFNSSPNVYWNVAFIQTANGYGPTHESSSGSPLINSDHRVIGQLRGGLASCENPFGTNKYGKFSISWNGNGNTDNRRRLNYWLNPGTSQTTLDGSYPFSINGPSIVCTSATYSIDNIKTGCSVTWSFKNASSLNSLIQSNSPSLNQCRIVPGSTNLNHTLVATIWYQGLVLTTLEKDIMTSKSLTGTIYQEGTYYSGRTYPSFTTDLEPLFVMNQVCQVTLQSPKFKNMDITTATTPSTSVNFQRIDDETIQISVAYQISDVDLRIYGTGDGSCNDFELRAVVMRNPIDLSNPFYINISGSMMELELNQAMMRTLNDSEDDENSLTQQPWSLVAYDATTGRMVYSGQVEGQRQIIDISGWDVGIYVIYAVINGKTYSTKVTIK